MLFSNLTFYVNKLIELDARTNSFAIEKMISRNGGKVRLLFHLPNPFSLL
jgi:hypothetical protein